MVRVRVTVSIVGLVNPHPNPNLNPTPNPNPNPNLNFNLFRQLIVEWLKDHSAFAGLPYSAWCKRLKDNSPEAHSRSLTFRFSSTVSK